MIRHWISASLMLYDSYFTSYSCENTAQQYFWEISPLFVVSHQIRVVEQENWNGKTMARLLWISLDYNRFSVSFWYQVELND